MPEVVLDTHIRLHPSEFPSVAVEQILSSLRIPNPAKEIAIREKVWGAQQLPDEVEMYFFEGDTLILPRGFYSSLLRGLEAYQILVSWRDERRYFEFFPLTGPDGALSPIELRSYQQPAVEALVSYEQGQYEAPTGSGKTSVCLEALRRVDQPTLIIVDRATLAEQWMEQIRDKLGAEAGYLGESQVEIRPITVALRQSIWARFDALEKETWNLLGLVEGSFFDLWGTVVVDEHHHASAETLQDILQRFPARYRWGVSATPERDPALFPIIQAIIGPILHRTTDEEAGESLVTPSVRVLTSDFEFDYHPTQEVERLDAYGEVVISPRTGKPMKDVVRNNYSDMMSALCLDTDRQNLIADEAFKEADAGHHVLIVSRRKNQLRDLHSRLDGLGILVQMLLGGEKGERKTEVQRAIEEAEGGSVLLSTVADEALDFPRLDRVVLAYPGRNAEVFKQQVGRILRPYSGKLDAVVIDIADMKVGLLRSQALERRRMLYNAKGWKVEVVERITA